MINLPTLFPQQSPEAFQLVNILLLHRWCPLIGKYTVLSATTSMLLVWQQLLSLVVNSVDTTIPENLFAIWEFRLLQTALAVAKVYAI